MLTGASCRSAVEARVHDLHDSADKEDRRTLFPLEVQAAFRVVVEPGSQGILYGKNFGH